MVHQMEYLIGLSNFQFPVLSTFCCSAVNVTIFSGSLISVMIAVPGIAVPFNF